VWIFKKEIKLNKLKTMSICKCNVIQKKFMNKIKFIEKLEKECKTHIEIN